MSHYERAIRLERRRAMSVSLDSIDVGGMNVVLLRADKLPAGIKTSIGRCLLARYLDTGQVTARTKAVVVHGSGNTARAVRLAADELAPEAKVVAVVFAETSKSTIAKLRKFGVEVVAESSRRSGRAGRQSVTERLCQRPGYVFLDQHEEPLIIDIQRRTFGQAIAARLTNPLTHFVAGMGTGGTVFGIGSALCAKSKTRVVAVEGVGSTLTLWHAYLGAKGKGYAKEKGSIEEALLLYKNAGMLTSLKCYPRRKDPGRWFEIDVDFPKGKKGVLGIEGLGVGNPTNLISDHLRQINQVRIVTDEQAREGVECLASHGIYAVESAGANFFAALRLGEGLQRRGQKGRILTVVTAGG